MRETILLKWPLLKKNLVNQRKDRRDCLLAIEEILILSGVEGNF